MGSRSTTMAFNKILVCALVGSVAGQNFRTFPSLGQSQNSFSNDIFTETTTTPVPILKFVDQHNTDGSYTYGFQSADGTYKLETRLASGGVKGKYGYFDADGNLKEITYGADKVTGFVPTIDGIEHPPPSISKPQVETNEIIDFVPTPAPKLTASRPVQLPKLNPRPRPQTRTQDSRTSLPSSRRFQNFAPQQQQQQQPQQQSPENFKVVNGRRAVLRKRVRPAVEQPQQKSNEQVLRDEQLNRQQQLKSRQNSLKELEQARQALYRLQQAQQSGVQPQPIRSEAQRSFSFLPRQQQQQRSFVPQQQQNNYYVNDPFVTHVDGEYGSSSI